MVEATWTIDACDPRAAAALAEALGISETTASVLVRRGYGDPDAARAFLAAELPGTIRSRSATWRRRATRSARRSRRRRGSACTATTTSTGSARRRSRSSCCASSAPTSDWHLPSRFEEGYGVVGRDARRGSPTRAAGSSSPSTAASPPSRRSRRRGARARRRRHRPPPARRRAPRLPDRRHPAVRLPVPGALRHRRRLQARPRRSSGRATRRSRATSTSSRSRRSPTSSRSSTRTAASRSPGSAALARTQKPGLRALMRAAARRPGRRRRGRGRLPARAADQRRRPARPPEAALELLLTEDEETARRLAGELEELNRDRQAVEDRILREAVAQVEAWPEARRSRRGYVARGRGLARGRDRHRRLAARRALPPAGRPDRRHGRATGRAPAARSRRSTCTPRSPPAPAHLERFGGHRAAAGLSIRPEARRRVRRGVRRARRRAPRRRRSAAGRRRSTRSSPARELTLDLCAELERLAPFGLGNPGVTLLVAGCELVELADGRRGQAPALPRRRARPPGRQRDRLRPGRAARPLPPRRPLRRRLPAGGEPLERHRRAAARRAADLRHARPLRRAARVARGRVARRRGSGARGAGDLRRARARAGRAVAQPARVGDVPRAARRARRCRAAARLRASELSRTTRADAHGGASSARSCGRSSAQQRRPHARWIASAVAVLRHGR